MGEKEFPHKAQSRLDLGLANPTRERVEKGVKPATMTTLDEGSIRMQTNDALKPSAMTPVTGSGEDRGLKPNPMTPAPKPAPAQPVNTPAQPKK
jgi:hypothetical protein